MNQQNFAAPPNANISQEQQEYDQLQAQLAELQKQLEGVKDSAISLPNAVNENANADQAAT